MGSVHTLDRNYPKRIVTNLKFDFKFVTIYNNWNNTKIYDFTIPSNLGNQSTNGEGQLNRPQLYWRLRNEKRTL